VDILLGTWIYF